MCYLKITLAPFKSNLPKDFQSRINQEYVFYSALLNFLRLTVEKWLVAPEY